jgi:hypothetical protein
MIIATLISVVKNIVGADGNVSPISYSGGKTTSKMVYVIPDFKKSKMQHQVLMNKIEMGLIQDPNTSSLTISRNDRENKIKLGSFSVFIKPFSNFNPKRVEEKQIQTLFKIFNNLDNSVGSPFKIKIGKKIYEIDLQKNGSNIIKKSTTIQGRETKSDFTIKTENLGDVYVSLKGDSSQQWSGVSDFLGEQEVKTFVGKIISKPIKSGWCQKITDDTLIKKSVYGKNYGQRTFGPENVNHIIIGENIEYNQILNKDYVEITGLKTYDNGDNLIISDSPHIQSSKDSKRNDLGFSNLRISIWRGSKGTLI